MVRSLLLRGMLAGLLGGIVAFGVGRVLGEPQVNKAIGFEEFVEYNVHHQPPETELISRDVQSTAGLGTATALYGAAFGGLFAIVFAATYGRLGTMTARGSAALLGLLGYVAVYVVPLLKYPANPPAIGNPDSIGRRTSLYLGMMVLSIMVTAIAVAFRRHLAPRFGEWNATLLAFGGWVVAIVAFYIILPGINEVPQAVIDGVVPAVTTAQTTFPPTVLWRFRVGSILIQAGMWATIALGFGALAERFFRKQAEESAGAQPSRSIDVNETVRASTTSPRS